jgi:predicted alpha/beta-hydrolase family hydrolase
VAGLLLLSYPLHAPGRPDLRTKHFPDLKPPALFVHGTRDPFGSIDQMEAALPVMAGPHELIVIDGAGHDLGGAKTAVRVAARVVEAFLRFSGKAA